MCISLPSSIKYFNERSKEWFIVDPEFIVRLVCSPSIWLVLAAAFLISSTFCSFYFS